MAEHAFSIDWMILIDLHTLYGHCPIVCLCEKIYPLIRYFFVMFLTFMINIIYNNNEGRFQIDNY